MKFAHPKSSMRFREDLRRLRYLRDVILAHPRKVDWHLWMANVSPRKARSMLTSIVFMCSGVVALTAHMWVHALVLIGVPLLRSAVIWYTEGRGPGQQGHDVGSRTDLGPE